MIHGARLSDSETYLEIESFSLTSEIRGLDKDMAPSAEESLWSNSNEAESTSREAEEAIPATTRRNSTCRRARGGSAMLNGRSANETTKKKKASHP